MKEPRVMYKPSVYYSQGLSQAQKKRIQQENERLIKESEKNVK